METSESAEMSRGHSQDSSLVGAVSRRPQAAWGFPWFPWGGSIPAAQRCSPSLSEGRARSRCGALRDTLRLPLTAFAFIWSCADSQLWKEASSVSHSNPSAGPDVCSATLLVHTPAPWNAAVPTEDQAGNIFISCRLTGSTVEQKTSSMEQTREQRTPPPG